MKEAEIHVSDGRTLRVIRFEIGDGERIERIVIPSPFSDNAMQIIPFKEEIEERKEAT